MDKNKELARNTIIITFGKICTQFASFLLLPFYTALLSTEQYGAVDLINTYIQLLLPIIIFQIDQAIFRCLVDERKTEEKKRGLISSAMAFIILQFFIVTGIFAIVSIWVTSRYYWFLYINVIGAVFSSIFLQIARGFGDNKSYSVGSFLAGFINVLLNVFLIAVLDMRAEGMMLAMFIGNVVCTFYICIIDKVFMYVNIKSIKRDVLKEMLRYSLPLVPNALSWWLVNASDRSIVLLFLGSSANGILAASHKFSSVFTSFYNIFNLSWTESAALHLQSEDRDTFFSNVIDTVYRVFIACCIGIIASMPFAFPIMVNENYAEAYYQIPIYMIASMFNVIVGLYSVVYIANKKTGEIAKTSIMAGIINIVINLVLIRFIGLYAASVSSAIAYAVMAIYRHFDIKKYVNHQINYRILWSSIIILIAELIFYYVRNKYLKVIGLTIAVIYAISINYKFLRKIIWIIRRNFEKIL